MTDDFRGDTPHLISCIKALLSLDAAGALVSHGIGGHARSLLSAAASRLALPPVAGEAERDQARVDLETIYDAFSIGAKARSIHILMMNLSNVLRRERCLAAVERTFFMVPTEPEDEDDGVWGEKCLLNWGQDPDDYVATFREALKTIAGEAVAGAIDARGQEGELLPTKDRIDAIVMVLDYLLSMKRHHHEHEWKTPLARTAHALEMHRMRKNLVDQITLLGMVPTPAEREQDASETISAKVDRVNLQVMRRFTSMWHADAVRLGYDGVGSLLESLLASRQESPASPDAGAGAVVVAPSMDKFEHVIQWLRDNYQDNNIATICDGLRSAYYALCRPSEAPEQQGEASELADDPYYNLLGVIADAKAGNFNAVCIETLERVASALALAAPATGKVGAVAPDRSALIDLIEDHLHGVYHCGRVWEAWNVGTMSEDDFTEASGSDFAPDLADAIMSTLATPAHTVQAETGEAVDAARWRRLVNASEIAFPVAAIADDPENDRIMLYGRKRLEQFIDGLDEIDDKYSDAALTAVQADTKGGV